MKNCKQLGQRARYVFECAISRLTPVGAKLFSSGAGPTVVTNDKFLLSSFEPLIEERFHYNQIKQ